MILRCGPSEFLVVPFPAGSYGAKVMFFCSRSFLVLASFAFSLAIGCQRQPVAASPAITATAEEKAPAKRAAEAAPDGPASALLSERELSEDWIALFDGQTLFGWKANSDANWRVENGVIVVDSGTPGLLCTTSQFSDYVLRCDFRAPAGTNSGIFLHTPLKPTDPAKDCYELNIA